MFINFAVTVAVSFVTPPPHRAQQRVEGVRYLRFRSVSERVDAVA